MAGKGKPRKPADPKFPRRINSRKAQDTGVMEPVDIIKGDFEVTSDEIGVSNPNPAPKSEVEPIQEPDTFFCYNCRGPLNEGDDPCPFCEVEIDWAKKQVIG